MAKRASRNTKDTAGGMILGNKAPTVYINGVPVTVVGDRVAGHGLNRHAGPIMATGSSDVFAHNIPVCRAGDIADCGHQTTSNSPDTYVN